MHLKKNIHKLLYFYKESELIKISSKNLIQVIIKLITGLLNIKITSILLGTSGMALLSQFVNIVQFSTSIANGGILHGVTKLTAQFDYSPNRQKYIVHNAFITTIFFSTITALILFLFADKISLTFLYDIKYGNILRSSGILIFSMAINNLILAFTNGLQLHNKYIYLNVISSIVTALIVLPAIYSYGLSGALWGQYISSITITIITIVSIKKYLPAFTNITFSKAINKRFVKFGLMLLVASTTTPLVKIITRNVIVENCSLNEAGWWDGISKISTTYISLIISALSLYMLPKISQILDYKTLNIEIKKGLKQIIPLVALGSITIYILREGIINLLFSPEFDGMKNLFFYQCFGDVMRIINWFFAITIMMKEQAKQYIIAEIIMTIVIITNAYIFIPRLGIIGSTFVYALNTIIYFIFVVIIYSRMVKKPLRQ